MNEQQSEPTVGGAEYAVSAYHEGYERRLFLSSETLWPSMRTMIKCHEEPVAMSLRAAAYVSRRAERDDDLSEIRTETFPYAGGGQR